MKGKLKRWSQLKSTLLRIFPFVLHCFMTAWC